MNKLIIKIVNLRWIVKALLSVTMFFLLNTSVFADGKIKKKNLPILFSTPSSYKSATGYTITSYQEAPTLAKLVSEGKLPPVSERLPKEPAVVEPLVSIGKYGGILKGPAVTPNCCSWDIVEMRLQKMLTFGTDYLTPVPNIAKSFKLSDDLKTITLTLREGMKWSDGRPLTVDDVEFFYKSILANKEVTPSPDNNWKAGGELVEFVRVDDYTFMWKFKIPNPAFVITLTSERGYTGIRPKHYLSKFHKDHNPDAENLAKELGFESWVKMLLEKEKPYTFTWFADAHLDPRQPTIESYIFVEKDSGGNKSFERNPYFFKVDVDGNQLPYTDGLRRLMVQDLEVQDLKGIAGDYTHYGWGALANYTTYKENEKSGGFVTRLLTYLRGNELTFSFNVNHSDPVKRKVYGDLRFRQAMSVAMNRDEINNLVYFGKATPRQASPVPSDSYYKEWMGNHFVQYDPKLANKLLDEMGMDKRDSDGFRIGPNGKTFIIQMEEGAPEPAWKKTAELVAKYWNDVGVRTDLKFVQVNLFQEKRNAGELDVPAWAYDVAEVPFWSGTNWQTLPPYGYGASEWHKWIQSDGAKGEKPPEEVIQQVKNYEKLQQITLDNPEYKVIATKIFETQIKNLYAIGTVGLPPQPLLIRSNLRNGPKNGEMWSWTYRQWVQFLPEQFWLDE